MLQFWIKILKLNIESVRRYGGAESRPQNRKVDETEFEIQRTQISSSIATL